MLGKNFFVKKKILIYGLGKSGISSYFFLKKDNDLYLYDDNKKIITSLEFKKKFINIKHIDKKIFDFIIISPGIDVNKCNLEIFLKKNSDKIVTDLDIFYSNYSKNKNITITGTNGKSTVVKILYDLLKKEKKDVRLVGNIGNPILEEKKILSKTIFVIEASSYQLEYSKYFKANYAAILNISPDHLERHGTLKRYVASKLRLFKNQGKNDYSFLDTQNKYLKRQLKNNKLQSELINVKSNLINNHLSKIKNPYFLTKGNKENLSFIYMISKKLKIRDKNFWYIINHFKNLKFRQQLIFKSKKISFINDSKSTSYASSIDILKSLEKVYWIVGGIPKSGDKFLLTKKECINFKAYIFGRNANYFKKQLKNKINYSCFDSIKNVLRNIITDMKIDKSPLHKTVLFSPAAASFDSFKNFEDRGYKFNKLLKETKFRKLIHAK